MNNVYDIRSGRPIAPATTYQDRKASKRERNIERRNARAAKYAAPAFDPERLALELRRA